MTQVDENRSVGTGEESAAHSRTHRRGEVRHGREAWGEREERHLPGRAALDMAISAFGIEAVGGIAGVVLTIIGLATIAPTTTAGIASIIVGAALVLGSIAMTIEHADITAHTGDAMSVALAYCGLAADYLCGIAAIVFGALALGGIADDILLSISAIVLGGALLLGGGTTSALLGGTITPGEGTASGAVAGAQMMAGLGAVALGSLGINSVANIHLPLTGLLIVGATLVITGTGISGRLMGMIHVGEYKAAGEAEETAE